MLLRKKVKKSEKRGLHSRENDYITNIRNEKESIMSKSKEDLKKEVASRLASELMANLSK
jgi:predicted thioredoxin/glutaredoxin